MATREKGLLDSITEFSLDLYRNLAAKSRDDNLIMSPSSVSIVMAMVRAGARNDTKTQMTKTLKLDKLEETDIHPEFEKLMTTLKLESNNYTLSVLNRLYPRIDKTILESYLQIVQKHFKTDVKQLDYESNPDGSRIKINKWVELETKSKIRDLLAPGVITDLTALVLVNVVLFKGDWADKFDEKATTKQRFYAKSETVQVDMMYKKFENVKYGRIDVLKCSALSLSYKGEELSMLVLLPDTNDGLSILEDNLSAYQLLSYDVASGSEITPCNKMCKPLVVYRFTGNVMTSITTLRS